MGMIKGLIRIFSGLIGIILILFSVICAGTGIFALVDGSESLSAAERGGIVFGMFLFAVLFWCVGRRLMGPKKESEQAAHQRRERMLGGTLQMNWMKYMRRYAVDDTKTLREAVQLMKNTDSIEELHISYETAQECLQLLWNARNAGVPVELDVDLQRLEGERIVAVNELLFRISARATREAYAAQTSERKQEWIRWGREGLEEVYRVEARSVDPEIYSKGLGLLDGAARTDYRP